jgi:hypothetical protein
VKPPTPLTLALVFVLAGPTAGYAERGAPKLDHHHPYVHHRHATTRNLVAAPKASPAPIATEPLFSPAERERKEGLSRDPESCMMGCLDNTQ